MARDNNGRPTKVYAIFPCGLGFTAKTPAHTNETIYTVAATSIRQAYAVAYKRVWINPEHAHPVGIISIYQRGKGVTLWCGCSGHDVHGGKVRHGTGVRALRTAIADHRNRCPTGRE